MNNKLTINGVKKIVLEKIRHYEKDTESNTDEFYVTDLRITSDDGTRTTIALFSKRKDSLKMVKEDKLFSEDFKDFKVVKGWDTPLIIIK